MRPSFSQARAPPRGPRGSPGSVSPSPQRWPAPRCPARSRARTAAADTAASARGGGLQEVVVTARKREENLQDVPLSIDVFTQKDMQNLGDHQFR